MAVVGLVIITNKPRSQSECRLLSSLSSPSLALSQPYRLPARASPASNIQSAAPTATCSPGPVVDYTVVSGDTVTIISQKLSSGICNIAELNNLENPGFINLGQVLRVPTFPCSDDNTSCLAVPSDNNECVAVGEPTYTIESGDTFFIVAADMGLSVNALQGANPGVDPLLLQINQVINVPLCNP
ncbi:intracellular hyphae protein 1 [Diaporthe helianthi]|uniref:Intracellular hyphae protein 1 n=1 Tax=Diaporthe helianthi TaxID=158607 RepID=A0A2P5HPA5_DIAHE|nr:intracellular hyphae protein 1 [Diaporthe helianthi]